MPIHTCVYVRACVSSSDIFPFAENVINDMAKHPLSKVLGIQTLLVLEYLKILKYLHIHKDIKFKYEFIHFL